MQTVDGVRVGPWAVGLARESNSIFDGVVQARSEGRAERACRVRLCDVCPPKTPPHTYTCVSGRIRAHVIDVVDEVSNVYRCVHVKCLDEGMEADVGQHIHSGLVVEKSKIGCL